MDLIRCGCLPGQSQELRVEIQQLKAKNHGLNTQMDALAADHERLAGLLDTAEKVCLGGRLVGFE